MLSAVVALLATFVAYLATNTDNAGASPITETLKP